MQLKNLGLLMGGVALAGLLLAACDGLPGDEGCTTDADCTGEGEVCHLGAKVCVATCEMASDCPDEEKTCAAAPWAGAGTTKICQCSTDALCGRAVEGEVCSVAYKICTSGQSTPTDGGMMTDGGTPGTACTGSAAQPAECAYGNYCGGTTCTTEMGGTCANLTAHGETWNRATSTGPVIYEVTKVSFAEDMAFCGAGAPTRVRATVKAYAGSNPATFPAASSGLTGQFHYVEVDGSEGFSEMGQVQSYMVTNGGKNVSFIMNFCRPSGATTLSTAFHFLNGNEYCAQITR